MKNSNNASEHVRPMLEAMARSIDAARAKRSATTSDSWTGSSEGTTSYTPQFIIGSQTAANGKAKAKPKSPASSFFRDSDNYRQAG